MNINCKFFFNLRCIISEKDGTKYCVRERSKITLAADRLADVNQKMQKLVEYCKNKDNLVLIFINKY